MKIKIGFQLLVMILAGLGLSSCSEKKDTAVSEPKHYGIKADLIPSRIVATFAGGCFWCLESSLEGLDGVKEVIPGYAGGEEVEATYKKVITGKTGHREAVQVFYDPQKIDYKTLVEHFFEQIDPTDDGGQFTDRGFQYTTAIYYLNKSQKFQAQEVLKEVEAANHFEKPIVTPLEPYTTFFTAEAFHQDFYKNSSEYYEKYKSASGRGDFMADNWVKEAALEFSR